MRSPYNLTAGPRRYWLLENIVMDTNNTSEPFGAGRTVAEAAQIADALELVDRMRNHQ